MDEPECSIESGYTNPGEEMANERITEDLVDDQLRQNGYYEDPDTVVVEKQQSTIEAIRSALAKAGKGGKGGRGYPEFIITSPATPDMVVVIECKAELKCHESPDRDKPVEYAVDGAPSTMQNTCHLITRRLPLRSAETRNPTLVVPANAKGRIGASQFASSHRCGDYANGPAVRSYRGCFV